MTALTTPGVSAATDLELAASAAGGDALAFELMVRRHNRLLFRTARGVVPDDAEAQDVVQETWLRAFGKLHTFRGESALGTWLARMAINLAISSQRRKGRLVQLHDDATMDQAMELPNLPASESPDASAERGEMRALLQASIEGLPPIYRSVFMLRAVEDMSVEEAAFCLGVSQDVIKTRFLRARALLREELASRVETGAHDTFAFAGARCDAVLAHVMGELGRQGLLRRTEFPSTPKETP
jgi:RNA polymerase sigma-70 factor (ECF subfamily)